MFFYIIAQILKENHINFKKINGSYLTTSRRLHIRGWRENVYDCRACDCVWCKCKRSLWIDLLDMPYDMKKRHRDHGAVAVYNKTSEFVP